MMIVMIVGDLTCLLAIFSYAYLNATTRILCSVNDRIKHHGKVRARPPAIRVPTQVAFSNSLCFLCSFPVRLQIFPVPIYEICDYMYNIYKLHVISNKILNFRGKYRNIFYF